MRPFTPTGPWSEGRSLLHVYLVPGETDRSVLTAYQEQVPDPSEYGVAWQPPSWAHLTVQRLDAAPEDLAPGELERLRARLADMPDDIGGPPLRMGPPIVGRRAVEAWIEPHEAWADLVDHVRAAVIVEGLVEYLPTERVHRPHLALGYGISEGDGTELQAQLLRARQPITSIPLTVLSLAAVQYRPGLGFEWEELAALPIPKPPVPDPFTGRHERPDRDSSRLEAIARGKTPPPPGRPPAPWRTSESGPEEDPGQIER